MLGQASSHTSDCMSTGVVFSDQCSDHGFDVLGGVGGCGLRVHRLGTSSTRLGAERAISIGGPIHRSTHFLITAIF